MIRVDSGDGFERGEHLFPGCAHIFPDNGHIFARPKGRLTHAVPPFRLDKRRIDGKKVYVIELIREQFTGKRDMFICDRIELPRENRQAHLTIS
ncbi:MAG: hypothetical protein IJR97_10425 [Clostridia bacterium]|nr:hypothetical protein [Clostridia bacterium]